MISLRHDVFRKLFFCVNLLNFSHIMLSSAVRIQSQSYMKMRASSRFTSGVQIAKISRKGLSASMCAAFCQFRNCQSFEFGCSSTSMNGSCKLSCSIYKNVPPQLEDEYFENQMDIDYYEIVFPLPPQEYHRSTGKLGRISDTFCGKVVKRKESGGLYTVAVHTVCYMIFLNASDAANWNMSKAACSTGGGKLIEPADFEEQMLIVKLMNRLANHPNYNQPAIPPSIWLGCSGRLKDWKWLDGSNVTNTFWHGTNPDSTRDFNCCATLYMNSSSTTFWMDRYCLDKTARMCVYDYLG